MTALEIKREVRERDGYKCRDCGMTNEKHLKKYGMSLDVHRVFPGSGYITTYCVTLCQECHHNKPRKIQNAFFGDPLETGAFVFTLNLYSPVHRVLFDSLECERRRLGHDSLQETILVMLDKACGEVPHDYCI